MENIKEKLSEILEQASCDTKKCKYCKSYKSGVCVFGSVNERMRITSPNYSCDNFDANYNLNEDTIDTLRDLLKSVKRVDEGVKNLELLLAGKITEDEFNDLVG